MTEKNILQAGPANAPFQRARNPRQRLLVVDDDLAIRQINSDVLTCCGYHVDTSIDGEAAWEALQLVDYDLMVTDNNMPKVTGVDLIQKLQAAGRTMPVIMLTGASPDEEFTRRQLQQPATTLLKPCTFAELLAAVKNVLRTASDSLGEMAPPPNWQVQPTPDRCRL